MTDRPLTSCCQVTAYLDPLFVDETNVRFAHYARCSKCHRLIGEAKILYTAPKGLKDAWNAYSEVAVREFHKPGEGRPMRFTQAKSGLVPVGWKPAQPEIDDQEPPF